MFKIGSVLVVLGLSLGCSPADPPRPAAGPRTSHSAAKLDAISRAELTRLDAKHLPNPVRIHPKVISGGLPEGDAGYKELADLGVKTIISVDGAKPDVEAARKFGMRYVHLPHGYDGIPDERVEALAKAVRDLEGPIYIHCHHGKHRSPAAASVACVAAGLIPPADAVPVLELAGTSPNYRGLYQTAEQTQPLGDALLDRLDLEFRETVEVAPMAEAMVALEHTHHNIQMVAEAGWKTPADHPDLEPAHEALLLREHFTEMLRTDDARHDSDEFRQLLLDSEADARSLESELRKWHSDATDGPPPNSITMFADSITVNCKNCHQAFRDTPLDEK